MCNVSFEWTYMFSCGFHAMLLVGRGFDSLSKVLITSGISHVVTVKQKEKKDKTVRDQILLQ